MIVGVVVVVVVCVSGKERKEEEEGVYDTQLGFIRRRASEKGERGERERGREKEEEEGGGIDSIN